MSIKNDDEKNEKWNTVKSRVEGVKRTKLKEDEISIEFLLRMFEKLKSIFVTF